MDEMERSSLDIALFALGAAGFIGCAVGVIGSSVAALVSGLILMLLSVGYFALTGEE